MIGIIRCNWCVFKIDLYRHALWYFSFISIGVFYACIVDIVDLFLCYLYVVHGISIIWCIVSVYDIQIVANVCGSIES